jgi:enoyl-CoA hydratase/carnithine racemase
MPYTDLLYLKPYTFNLLFSSTLNPHMETIMDYEEILVSTKGAVAYLTLNNPKKINALSKLMISEIIHALGEISADEAIKVLVIRAAGKHFCAGHFLAEMVDGNLSEYKSIFDQCNRMMQMIHDIPQPVIAQVQGFYAQVDQPDSDAMDFAKQTMTMNLVAEDAQGGIKAFMEKRKPIWKNK